MLQETKKLAFEFNETSVRVHVRVHVRVRACVLQVSTAV